MVGDFFLPFLMVGDFFSLLLMLGDLFSPVMPGVMSVMSSAVLPPNK